MFGKKRAESVIQPDAMSLAFTMLRGDDLICADKNVDGTASSDPYVQISLFPSDAVIAKTSVVKTNAVCPVWPEVVGKAFAWDGEKVTLQFTVWDHDAVGSDDFLGTARVDITPELLGLELAVVLGPRVKPAKDSGSTDVADMTHSNKDLEELRAQKRTSFGRLWFTLQPATLRGGVPAAPLPPLRWSEDAEPRLWMLRVAALEATDLPPVDGKTCDPRVHLRISGKVQMWTKHIKKCKGDASWTDLTQMAFPWVGRGGWLPHALFCVIDADTVGFDRTIGMNHSRLKLSDITGRTTYTLESNPRDGKSAVIVKQFGSNLGSLTVAWETTAAKRIRNLLATKEMEAEFAAQVAQDSDAAHGRIRSEFEEAETPLDATVSFLNQRAEEEEEEEEEEEKEAEPEVAPEAVVEAVVQAQAPEPEEPEVPFVIGSRVSGRCRQGTLLFARKEPFPWRCDECNALSTDQPNGAMKVSLFSATTNYRRCRACDTLFSEWAREKLAAADEAKAAAERAAAEEAEAEAARLRERAAAKETRAVERKRVAAEAEAERRTQQQRWADQYAASVARDAARAHDAEAQRAAAVAARERRDLLAAEVCRDGAAYWGSRWDAGQTHWKALEAPGVAGAMAVQNLAALCAGAPQPEGLHATTGSAAARIPELPPRPLAGSRVLVPLCGDSAAVDFFYLEGHAHAFGIDIAELAITTAADRVTQRTGVAPVRTVVALPVGPFAGGAAKTTTATPKSASAAEPASCVQYRWSAPDGRSSLTLLQGDFFAIMPSLLVAGAPYALCGEGFDLVYDRTSFVAIPPELREWYAEHMARALRPPPVGNPRAAIVDEASAAALAAQLGKQPALRIPWCPSILLERCHRQEGVRYAAKPSSTGALRLEGPPFHLEANDIPASHYTATSGFDDSKVFLLPSSSLLLAGLMPTWEWTFDVNGVYRSGWIERVKPKEPEAPAVASGAAEPDAGTAGATTNTDAKEDDWPFASPRPADRFFEPEGHNPLRPHEFDGIVLNGQGVPSLNPF